MILVTGGARSGKSAHVEQLALSQCERVLYIATSVITDDEMAQRVKNIGHSVLHTGAPGRGIAISAT